MKLEFEKLSAQLKELELQKTEYKKNLSEKILSNLQDSNPDIKVKFNKDETVSLQISLKPNEEMKDLCQSYQALS